jgi:hypothetical protein
MSRTNQRVVVRSQGPSATAVSAGALKRVRVLGKLLDNSIAVPGTNWKIGLDPIIGLIPGVGDLAGALLSGYIVLEAVRAEIPTLTLLRMLTNVGIDTLLGAIPALGDVFDAAWKANAMNVALLERHLSTSDVAAAPRGRNVLGVLAIAILALVIIVGAGLALGIFAARLLWGLKTG